MSNMNQSQKRKKIFLRKYSKPASQRETTWPNHTVEEKPHGQKRKNTKPKQFSKSEILKKIAEDTETETETESEEPEEQSLNQIFGLGLVEFFVFFSLFWVIVRSKLTIKWSIAHFDGCLLIGLSQKFSN